VSSVTVLYIQEPLDFLSDFAYIFAG
jgi:hypothetical protein